MILRLSPPIACQEVLLHTCCAPCSTAIVECMLDNNIRPTLFFFNPNIYPKEEYDRRKAEAIRFSREKGLAFVDADYEYEEWKKSMKGLENEPERGLRCEKCFLFRLRKAAEYASKHGFKFFATTLASSRWKDLRQVNNAGLLAASEHKNLVFWEQNWRKGGLQERRNALLKEYNFYNQRYCGCEFSLLSSRNPCKVQEP